MQNIEQKLESSLGRKSDLDSRLKSASSSVLTQKIDFQESSKPHSSVTDMLKGKYVNLASAAGASVHKSPSGECIIFLVFITLASFLTDVSSCSFHIRNDFIVATSRAQENLNVKII